MSKPTVVLIGHGVSGKFVMKELANQGLGKINLVVVESREHWECDSLSPVFLYDDEQFEKNSAPVFGKMVDGVTYMNDVVASVAPAKGGSKYTVALQSGGDSIEASAVICATGSHIPLLKPKLGETKAAHKARFEAARTAISGAKTIMVVGAGPVGIELAGSAAKLKSPDAKVVLVASNDTILYDGFKASARASLTTFMESEGVQMSYNSKVTGPANALGDDEILTPGTYQVKQGDKTVDIQADVYLRSYSTFNSPLAKSDKGAVVDARGKVIVDEYLQSTVYPGVFAISCSTADNIINQDTIGASAKVVAANALAVAASAGGEGDAMVTKLTPLGAPAHTADPWVHYRWGDYTVMNLPAPMDRVSWLCGFPFPCFCCVPGCCMPCGYSCSPAEGRGPSQALKKMILDGDSPMVTMMRS
jgi:NADH dehydrogenase FAD-containing subunit